ncbi:MAG: hypothetical protein FWE23_01770 [Chitinivibrionia bacterium]|nr:hypothetical protein [Chitinivibrionia bacterium]
MIALENAFASGVFSVFDISGQKLLSGYKYSGNGFSRDAFSLRNDWNKIGGDIYKAIGVFNNEK